MLIREYSRGGNKVEIGFFFWPYDVALVRAMAEAADAFGYDLVGIADTPGIAMDPWVATTLLAARTQRARVAVCVTNLVTRHPAVSAASIASVNLLAPGRVLLGIGVGHSGTRNLGAPSLCRRASSRTAWRSSESSCGVVRPPIAGGTPICRG